jgi:general secretion pathway protein E
MGREMICEVLPITEKLSSLIANAASKEEMLKVALEEGFVPIYKNGIQKAIDGVTSIEEVLKVAKG